MLATRLAFCCTVFECAHISCINVHSYVKKVDNIVFFKNHCWHVLITRCTVINVYKLYIPPAL